LLAVEHYQLEALRARRASRAAWRRRRRHIWGALVLLVVAAGVLLWAAEPVGPHRPASALSRSPQALAGLPSFGQKQTRIAVPTAAQLAAVKQLAARGLPLYCGGHGKPMIALTFDDGPGVYTNLAVKKLREFHLVATFFVVGKSIRAWPRRLGLEEPLAVFGDHTLTHPFLPALPPAAMVHEIAGARAFIERATREPVVLFRPPYDGRTPAIDGEVRSLGMLEVLWNVDSQDSLGANYAGIERNVIAGLKPGSIILMHENRGQTIRALPTIFVALKRDHLRAVTVPELVADDPPSFGQLRAGVGGCPISHRVGNGS
jgi:peptidoglycan/xylan/chitin deacetylase (PgdA/CDA1 family)